MNIKAAKQFILQNARPIDLAIYQYYFENQSNQMVSVELLNYQNKDGGFGMVLSQISSIQIQVQLQPMMRLSLFFVWALL